MLFKLSLKNIKKSMKDYTVYFLTLFLSVAVFYIFNSIQDQQAYITMTSQEHGLFTTMWAPIIREISVIVSIVLGILIVYANMFLIKRRKKEFGVYMLLGMSKIKIALVIVLETVFVAILSLVLGLILGVFASQMMTVLVAKMFESNMDKFVFVFSPNSFGQTCLYFSVMYVVVLVFSTVAVSRYKLINLLNSAKKNERIKIKNPIVSTVIFVIGVAMLGYAYWLVTGNFENIRDFDTILIAIILGSVSTFLIFWSLSGLLLKIAQSSKRFYLKGMNIFVLRQIDSKINTTVIGMTIICLMLFVTISMLSVSIALRNALTSDLDRFAPVDVNITVDCYDTITYDENEGKIIGVNNPEEFKNMKVSELLTSYGLKKDILKEVAEVGLYVDVDFTGGQLFKDSRDKIYDTVMARHDEVLGDYYEGYTKDNINLVKIMKQSDYNQLAEMYHIDKVDLSDNEYAFVCNIEVMKELGNMALENGNRITVLSKTYQPKYRQVIEGFYQIADSENEYGFVVIPDSGITEDNLYYRLMAANYNGNDKIEKEKLENEFDEFVVKWCADNKNYGIFTISRSEIFNGNMGASTIIAFVSIYISIVFLITGAAILSLKQLTESTDNKEKYTILRKLGCDEKMINKALFQQIAVFFLMPLLLAVIHSVFGITFASLALTRAYQFSYLISSIIWTAVILIIVYGAYFIATYVGSKNIIKGK